MCSLTFALSIMHDTALLGTHKLVKRTGAHRDHSEDSGHCD